MFSTKVFMIALHVPASFAKDKNKPLRAVYQIGKRVEVRNQWRFIEEIRISARGQ
jgi:hypothetical protein